MKILNRPSRILTGSRGDFRGVPGFGHIGHHHISIAGKFLLIEMTKRVWIHVALQNSARIKKLSICVKFICFWLILAHILNRVHHRKSPRPGVRKPPVTAQLRKKIISIDPVATRESIPNRWRRSGAPRTTLCGILSFGAVIEGSWES